MPKGYLVFLPFPLAAVDVANGPKSQSHTFPPDPTLASTLHVRSTSSPVVFRLILEMFLDD